MLLYAVLSMLVTICIIGFGRMAYGLIMPLMMESLSLTYEQAGLLGTATAFGYLIMIFLVGLMSTKWGSKQLVLIGLLLLAVGLMLSFVNSYIVSILAMVILGIGTAFGYTPMINIIVGWFPQNRGLMVGFLLSGTGIGTAIASLLTSIVSYWSQSEGWRYLWLLFCAFTIFTFLLVLVLLKKPPAYEDDINREKKSLKEEVFLQKGIIRLALVYGLLGFAYLIPQSYLYSFILQNGIKEYIAGLIMGLGKLLGIMSGPVWGMISYRIGRKRSLTFALSINGISVLLSILFPVLVGFFLSQLLWVLTMLGTFSLIQVLSTEKTHRNYAPAALGYVTIYFAAGQMLGPGIG